ncbi:helix-turn-helix domain-containing protein [Novosphingobium sp.]|uniref:helix-turn-helix domain-containing protein n=1 Tax=Novosphingobium sp. TaxID=1874826 RepID=UPI0026049A7A|nr:helix-turn-helix domain-containing protein [Novosphingobium sp.]
MPPFTVLTEPELAKMLHTSQRSLRNARLGGGLPYVKIGRLIRYRIEDVTAFLDRATIANEQHAPTTCKSLSVSTSARAEVAQMRAGKRN